MTSLAGKTILMSGGSRGIGLAIARALAEAGADVIVSARTDPGGTDPGPTLVVLGDSHARQLLTPIHRVADAQG